MEGALERCLALRPGQGTFDFAEENRLAQHVDVASLELEKLSRSGLEKREKNCFALLTPTRRGRDQQIELARKVQMRRAEALFRGARFVEQSAEVPQTKRLRQGRRKGHF